MIVIQTNINMVGQSQKGGMGEAGLKGVGS